MGEVRTAEPAGAAGPRERIAFRRLLVGQTVSQLGTAISGVVLPMIAVIRLHGSPLEVGAVTGADYIALSFFGPMAGVYVDRWQRRTVMLTTDLARAATIAAVPVLWVTGLLRIWQLVVLAALLGLLSLFFDTAYQAFVPTVVSRDRLIRGNARMQVNISATSLAGPGAAGLLVQLAGPPFALLTDVLSYFVSWHEIRRVHGRETHVGDTERPRVWAGFLEGLRHVRGDRILVRFIGTVAHFNFLVTAQQALTVLFLIRTLHTAPSVTGFLLASGGAGAVAGAATARRICAHLGVGPAMVIATVAGPLLGLLIPLTHSGIRLAYFVVGAAALGATTAVLKVVGQSYRQSMVPPRLLGRIVATTRMITWGPLPLAGLLGGVLGQLIGPRPALLVIGVLLTAAPLWLIPAGVWRLRDLEGEGAR